MTEHLSALWQSSKLLGMAGLFVPEEFGGLEASSDLAAAVLTELGAAAIPIPLTNILVVSKALTRWGTRVQQERYFPGIVSGETSWAVAFAEEPDRGFESPGCMLSENGTVSGRKIASAFAGNADYVLLSLQSSDQKTSLAIVDLRDQCERRFLETIDNTRNIADIDFVGSPADLLALSDVLTPLADLATYTAWEQLGGAGACLDMAKQYALERRAFGQVIGKFQAVKHRLADMYTGIEIARGNASVATRSLQNPRLALLYAAAARQSSTKAYEFAATENIQLHGALGCTWESDCHIHYRRSRALALELGSLVWWSNQLVDQVCSTWLEAS